MRDIGSRINRIEKQLSVGKHQKPTLPAIILCLTKGRMMNAQDRQELGPEETWLTYQERLQAGEKANIEYLRDNPDGPVKIIQIELDVAKEFQARIERGDEHEKRSITD
jgi:hypothetical protein